MTVFGTSLGYKRFIFVKSHPLNNDLYMKAVLKRDGSSSFFTLLRVIAGVLFFVCEIESNIQYLHIFFL